nr:immunoglobulin heavy chain junction region [Macaca mulatta]
CARGGWVQYVDDFLSDYFDFW